MKLLPFFLCADQHYWLLQKDHMLHLPKNMTSETEDNCDAFISAWWQDTDTFISLKRENILKEKTKM